MEDDLYYMVAGTTNFNRVHGHESRETEYDEYTEIPDVFSNDES